MNNCFLGKPGPGPGPRSAPGPHSSCVWPTCLACSLVRLRPLCVSSGQSVHGYVVFRGFSSSLSPSSASDVIYAANGTGSQFFFLPEWDFFHGTAERWSLNNVVIRAAMSLRPLVLGMAFEKCLFWTGPVGRTLWSSSFSDLLCAPPLLLLSARNSIKV